MRREQTAAPGMAVKIYRKAGIFAELGGPKSGNCGSAL
jgi:hypothetical protein